MLNYSCRLLTVKSCVQMEKWWKLCMCEKGVYKTVEHLKLECKNKDVKGSGRMK